MNRTERHDTIFINFGHIDGEFRVFQNTILALMSLKRQLLVEEAAKLVQVVFESQNVLGLHFSKHRKIPSAAKSHEKRLKTMRPPFGIDQKNIGHFESFLIFIIFL